MKFTPRSFKCCSISIALNPSWRIGAGMHRKLKTNGGVIPEKLFQADLRFGMTSETAPLISAVGCKNTLITATRYTIGLYVLDVIHAGRQRPFKKSRRCAFPFRGASPHRTR